MYHACVVRSHNASRRRAPCRALPDDVNPNAGRQREARQACDVEPPSSGGADLPGLHCQAGAWHMRCTVQCTCFCTHTALQCLTSQPTARSLPRLRSHHRLRSRHRLRSHHRSGLPPPPPMRPACCFPARPCLRPAPMLPLSRPRPRPMPTPCTAAATHAAAHHRSRLRTIRSAHYLDEDRYIPRTLEVRWLCMYAHTHAACVHTHTAHVATGSLQHGCRPPSRRRRAKESKRGAPHRAPPDPRQEERPPDPRQEERRPAPAMTPPPRLHHRGRSRCRSRCRSRRRRRRRPQRPRRQASRRPCSMPPPSCRSLTCRCLRRRRRRRCRREARTRNREGRHGGSSSSRAAGSLSLPSGRHPPTGRSGRRALGGGRASQARGTARHPARATG